MPKETLAHGPGGDDGREIVGDPTTAGTGTWASVPWLNRVFLLPLEKLYIAAKTGKRITIEVPDPLTEGVFTLLLAAYPAVVEEDGVEHVKVSFSTQKAGVCPQFLQASGASPITTLKNFHNITAEFAAQPGAGVKASEFLREDTSRGIEYLFVGTKVIENFTAKTIKMVTDSFSAEFVLPSLPADWKGDEGTPDFKAIGTLSPATLRTIEPVGPHFLAHARRARHKRTFSEDDRIQAQESAKKIEKDDDSDISEFEDPTMLLRDAKDWKSQDHYQVLGLSKYRYKATEDQIKRAHRKKVLKHHPDKKAAAGTADDDNFFKCIQKATEVLLDPVKRRQFDSVDEKADVPQPTKKQLAKGPSAFYKLWGKLFEAEARFSKVQPVPTFGDANSHKETVEEFYNFWYNFDSWRSFEYLDEDVPDDNENRDQKRHMERKNTNSRKKKKQEDNARLRKLLDDCSAADERIKRFRQEASAAKNKKKHDKEAAEKKAASDAKAKKEADERAAKEAEETAKVEKEASKKAKEAAKNAVKKNKRVLKGSVKDANYFAAAGSEPSPAQIDAVLGDVELLQGKLDPDEIATLAAKLGNLKVADDIKGVWQEEAKRLVGAGKIKAADVKTLA